MMFKVILDGHTFYADTAARTVVYGGDLTKLTEAQ